MKKLSVPENISLQKEIIKGLSAAGLRRLMIALAPGLAVEVAAWNILHDPAARLLSMCILLGYIAMCYGVFCSLDGSQSIYSFLMRWVAFMRSQKHYPYITKEESCFAKKQ